MKRGTAISGVGAVGAACFVAGFVLAASMVKSRHTEIQGRDQHIESLTREMSSLVNKNFYLHEQLTKTLQASRRFSTPRVHSDSRRLAVERLARPALLASVPGSSPSTLPDGQIASLRIEQTPGRGTFDPAFPEEPLEARSEKPMRKEWRRDAVLLLDDDPDRALAEDAENPDPGNATWELGHEEMRALERQIEELTRADEDADRDVDESARDLAQKKAARDVAHAQRRALVDRLKALAKIEKAETAKNP